ncbi:hypothetical protein PR048_010973 [Dryococelus australis]|uniref:Uncharacterized protein n=1 Tax=Dryococelus australis TaxID=614101 RepID=A0ABQ9HKD2_9NEOP|nr:hypothetical protein PR048_010973 [Dryococelus australis]
MDCTSSLNRKFVIVETVGSISRFGVDKDASNHGSMNIFPNLSSNYVTRSISLINNCYRSAKLIG